MKVVDGIQSSTHAYALSTHVGNLLTLKSVEFETAKCVELAQMHLPLTSRGCSKYLQVRAIDLSLPHSSRQLQSLTTQRGFSVLQDPSY